MEPVRVKICGITSVGDARAAVRAGADALGFLVGLLYPSADQLTAAEAAAIIATLPPFVSPTLVTHRSSLDEVSALCRTARVLAGGLTPENVAGAVERVLPWAVDVNTGVSLRRGVKSPERMQSFVRQAKRALSHSPV